MSRVRLTLGGLVLAVALTAAAADPVSLEWKPKVGDHHFYKFEMAVTSPSDSDAGSFKVTADLKQTVHSIEKDGSVTMDRRWTKFAAMANGQEASDDDKPPDITTRVTFSQSGDQLDEHELNDDGTVKVEKKPDGKSGDDSDEGFFSPPFPEISFPKGPIEIGATWQDEDDSDKKDDKKGGKKKADPKAAPKPDDPLAQMSGNVFYKLEGEETVAKVDCYRIDVDTKSDKDKGLTIFGHIWVAKSDGSLVQSDIKIHGIKMSPDQPVMNVDITANLDD